MEIGAPGTGLLALLALFSVWLLIRAQNRAAIAPNAVAFEENLRRDDPEMAQRDGTAPNVAEAFGIATRQIGQELRTRQREAERRRHTIGTADSLDIDIDP